MRLSEQNSFSNTSIVNLHDDVFLNNQRIAGKIAAKTILLLEKEVKNKSNKSLIDLNNMAETYIESMGGFPTFKNYKGFPAGVCISVNKKMVHGIPDDYCLQEGDVISFDLGVTINGAIADTAATFIFGEPKSQQHVKMIEANEEALMRGIKSIEVGKKTGCIGYAINKCVKGYGFNIINNYGGHGISITSDGIGIPHAAPFIANKNNIDEGIIIQNGLSIAIEPMLTNGSTRTWVDKDGWTVWCDAEMSVHHEHTVHIHENNVEIITDRSKL